MRLLVMFDLPTETPQNRKAYRQFRKFLIDEGFTMLQYSVYVRVQPSTKATELLMNRVQINAPSEGHIQALSVTEKQYDRMKTIIGVPNDTIKNSSERIIVL